MTSEMWLGDPSLRELLGEGELEIEGRLRDASNTTLRCVDRCRGRPQRAVRLQARRGGASAVGLPRPDADAS